MNENEHLSQDRLMAYILGRVEETELSRIDRHLADCPTCRDLADTIPPDDFVRDLRSATSANLTSGATPQTGETTLASASVAVPVATAVPAELAQHPRYRVVSLLGQGGMSTVYRAEHLRMERPVAIKVLKPGLMENAEAAERFQVEMKAAARLQHPNIVTAYDADTAGQLHFLVMEYVEGKSLAQVLKERGPLPIRDACEYVRQAAVGMQHAFECGMVHRDLKPHNLILTTGGQVKILDFGLARFLSQHRGDLSPDKPDQALTGIGVVMGTADYMAPEQASDAHAADIRADIYSLGCTLYQLLSGSVPYPGGSFIDKIKAHAARRPQLLTKLRPEVPRELAGIVEKMMDPDPARRYQTPSEVADALATVLSPPAPRRRRRPLLAAAIFAVLLIGAAVAVYRIQTDRGTVEIRTDDNDVEVLIKQGGKLVRISDAKTGRAFELRSGEYLVELGGKEEGLRLSTDTLRVQRGKETILEVRRLVPGKDGGPNAPHEWTRAVAVSSDRARIATAGADRAVRLWDLARREEVRVLRGHTESVLDVAFSPDGKQLASAGADRSVRVWDLETGTPVRLLPHPDRVLAVAFAPDGRTIATGCADKLVRLWNVADGRKAREMEGHEEPVTCVAFLPDGQRLVSGSKDKTLRMWETTIGWEMRVLEGHEDTVLRVAIAPDARRILSAGKDHTLRLWDASNGIMLRRLDHGCPVDCVGFSPDGRCALSGGEGLLVRLWDLDTGAELKLLEGPTEAVMGVTFLDEARRALGVDQGGRMHFWPLPALPSQPVTSFWPAESLARGEVLAPDLTKAPRVLHDEFSNPNSGFVIGKRDGVSCGYANGRYFIEHENARTFTSWTVPGNVPRAFACEVSGRVTKNPAQRWTLLLINRTDQTTSLQVTLTGQGTVSVVPTGYEIEPYRGPALGPVSVPWMKGGDAFNTLLVVLHGRVLEVYVNGKAPFDPIVLDRDVTPTLLTLGCDAPLGPERVEFQHVSIWNAEALPTPAERGAVARVPAPPVPRDLKDAAVLLDLDFRKPEEVRGRVFLQEQEAGRFALTEGEYQVAARQQGLAWGGPGDLLGSLSDFVMEFEGRLARSNPAGSWGAAWGHTNHGPYQSVFLRELGQARQLSLWSGPSHTMKELTPWVDVPELRTLTEFNTVRLEVTGWRVRLFVNGKHVLDYGRSDALHAGTLWLVSETVNATPTDARFRRLRIWRTSPEREPTPQGQPLYQTDFRNPVAEFPTLPMRPVTGYEEGVYFIRAVASGHPTAGQVPAQPLHNFHAEVVGRAVPAARGGWGLACGGTHVEVRGDGTYRIRHIVKDSIRLLTPLPEPGWKKHPALKAGEFNTLQVTMRDNLLTIWFNGQWACDVFDADHQPDRLHLAASGAGAQTRAEFRSLKVWALAER
jgi:WD40 repeat protein/tRNA A-37 threonylcarbamoyl transferase component Bud32